MGLNKRQRANRRAREERADKTAIPPDAGEKERRPIRSLENLYEITLDGNLYSVRAGRFIQHKYYRGRTYIEVEIDGETRQMNVRDAVEEAWEGVMQVHEVTLTITAYVAAPTVRKAEAEAVAHRKAIYAREGRTPETTVLTAWSTVQEFLDTMGPNGGEITVTTATGAEASPLDVLPDPDGVFAGEGATYDGECSFCTVQRAHITEESGLCRACRIQKPLGSL